MFHRIGRFVVRRAWLVLAVGVVGLVAGGVLGASAFDKLKAGGFEDPAAESTLARDRIAESFGGEPNLVLLVRAKSGSVDDTAPAAAGARVTDSLAADPAVSAVTSYWSTGARSLKATDGSSALILLSTTPEQSDDLIARYAQDGTDVAIQAGGELATFADVEAQLQTDLSLAESIAIPLTLALLVLAFGNVVAALLTVLIGGVAIVGTFAELSLFAELTDVSVYAVNLTVGLGLGLAVDYGLLMVSRFREERERTPERDVAVVRAVETAGRTIVFSGATIVAALAALVVFPLYYLRSFALAGMGVVVIAAVSAVLLLPALLSLLGPRADAWRVPWSRSLPRTEAPFWGRLADLVMRRPLLTAVPVLLALAAAASPLLDIRFGTADDRILQASAPSRQVGDTLRSDYGTADSTAFELVTTSAVAPAPLADYAAALSRQPGVERVDASAGTFVDGQLIGVSAPSAALGRDDAQRLAVVTALDARSDEAQQLVADVRALPAPAGTEVLVGGPSAALVDTKQAIADRLPIAGSWIIVTTFVLLFLFTGSIVQPIRALLLNVVSLAATLGTLVFVFQQGNFAGLLGVTPGPLDTGMVVLLFCIAFGLSMDYEVFVLSRIKEMHDRGVDGRAAVTRGLTRSGRIVSTAAALIAVSFFAFVISEVSLIQFFGLGAGLAILIDATLVRGVLVPAAMRLLGRHAWYAPAPLRRLHERVGLSESAPVDAPPEPVGATR